MEAAIIWIALIIIFAVVEIITVGLTSIWFAGGALAAVIVSVAGGGIACRRSRAWTGMAVCSICGRVGDPACIYKTMGIKIYEAASCENKL